MSVMIYSQLYYFISYKQYNNNCIILLFSYINKYINIIEEVHKLLI